MFKATKTHKHARVINELASGVFKASSSLPSEFHSIGKVLYAGHKIGSMGDIISKIEPIIDDLKQAIENIVNQAAARANVRLKGSFKSSADSEQKNICDSLSRNIGSMVGDAILNLIQRKVTNPMISWGVSYIIDESVENYQRKQQMLVANHKYQVKQAEELEQDLSEKINPKQKAPGGKTKQPTSIPKPFDYSLLLAQKTNQELVQLNKQSMEYLTYFFEASEKKTQRAEQVRVYDVTRSRAQSSMFSDAYSELFGIPTVYANTGSANAVYGSQIFGGGYGVLRHAARGSLALGEMVLSGASAPILLSATVAAGGVIGLHNAAQFEHEHPWIGDDFNEIMLNPLVPQSTKDAMWKQMQNDPLLVGQRQSEQIVLLPHINVNELPQLNPFARHSSNTVSSIMLDPKYNRPSIEIFPVHHQQKSILFTPDNQDYTLEWSKLPGFTPHVLDLKDLQEGRDIHETHWKDFILYNDYEIDHWNVKPARVKDAPEVYQSGKFGKIYKDPEQTVGNKEIWWSKDTAKHGGASQGLTPSTYKLFVIKDGVFQWIGDADANGNIIKGKHKGEIGEKINIKDCWKVK